MNLDPGCALWREHEDGSKSAHFRSIDPLEAECARVLGFATGESHEYCVMSAREFLAIWRHLERQVPDDDAAMERCRIVSLIRDRQDEIMRGKVGDGFDLIRLNELVGLLDSIQNG